MIHPDDTTARPDPSVTARPPGSDGPHARIGIVGAGGVAERHAETLRGFADVSIVGVADLSAPRAQALADACAARAYADAPSLLEAEAPDALYICVPPFAHGPPERAALAAGVPFFVEKPLAADLETAGSIAAEVEDAGILTATGYHWRNLDTLDRARELLDGRPARLAVAAWLDKVPPVPWWTQRERSGGQTVEQSTHLLDVLLALLGDVDRVSSVGARTERAAFPDADIDDAVVSTLIFRSGAIGSLASTSLAAAKHRAGVEVFADGLALVLTEDELVVDLGDGPRRTPADGQAKRRVDRDFVDAVLGKGDAIRAPYASALRTHRLACALTRSAEEGRPVDV